MLHKKRWFIPLFLALLSPGVSGATAGVSFDSRHFRTFEFSDTGRFVIITYAGRKRLSAGSPPQTVLELCLVERCHGKEMIRLATGKKRRPGKENTRSAKCLSSVSTDRMTMTIRYPERYRQFYPRGLQAWDIIPESEYRHWDFAEPVCRRPPVVIRPMSRDSLRPRVHSGLATVHPELILPDGPADNPAGGFSMDPWSREIEKPYLALDTAGFKPFLSAVMSGLSGYSGYLGMQRIRLELFDHPEMAAFYAGLYRHYVDSLYTILHDSLHIGRGDDEAFIRETSSRLTRRFAYHSNYLLWEGLSRNMLDCDNTACIAYDLGKKLGLDVAFVLLRLHAVVRVGEWIYETTGTTYFPESELNKQYDHVFLISSNTEQIQRILTTYELSNFLSNQGSHTAAWTIAREGYSMFPDDPQLLQTLGDISFEKKQYREAVRYYEEASRTLKDDLLLAMRLNQAKMKLSGRNDYSITISD